MSTTIVPTIWYQGKRVARTIVQFLIVAVPVANAVAAVVIEYLRTQQDVPVPGWVFAALNAILAVTALIIGLVTKVMAIDKVNALLTHIGLGSVPADKVRLEPNGEGVYVLPDPKTSTREQYQDAAARITHPGAHNEN